MCIKRAGRWMCSGLAVCDTLGLMVLAWVTPTLQVWKLSSVLDGAGSGVGIAVCQKRQRKNKTSTANPILPAGPVVLRSKRQAPHQSTHHHIVKSFLFVRPHIENLRWVVFQTTIMDDTCSDTCTKGCSRRGSTFCLDKLSDAMHQVHELPDMHDSLARTGPDMALAFRLAWWRALDRTIILRVITLVAHASPDLNLGTKWCRFLRCMLQQDLNTSLYCLSVREIAMCTCALIVAGVKHVRAHAEYRRYLPKRWDIMLADMEVRKFALADVATLVAVQSHLECFVHDHSAADPDRGPFEILRAWPALRHVFLGRDQFLKEGRTAHILADACVAAVANDLQETWAEPFMHFTYLYRGMQRALPSLPPVQRHACAQRIAETVNLDYHRFGVGKETADTHGAMATSMLTWLPVEAYQYLDTDVFAQVPLQIIRPLLEIHRWSDMRTRWAWACARCARGT